MRFKATVVERIRPLEEIKSQQPWTALLGLLVLISMAQLLADELWVAT